MSQPLPPHPLSVPQSAAQAIFGKGVKDHRLDLDRHLNEAKIFHGHICGGIVIGVRMALLGLDLLGIREPKGPEGKDLLVFVEIDRCATDAITSVTGCRPGRRSMKLKDYGRMAATFLRISTGEAWRISTLDRPDPAESPESVLARLRTISDRDLLKAIPVKVALDPGDLPGRPIRAVACTRCEEMILDARDVAGPDGPMCRPCASGTAYYEILDRAEA